MLPELPWPCPHRPTDEVVNMQMALDRKNVPHFWFIVFFRFHTKVISYGLDLVSLKVAVS